MHLGTCKKLYLLIFFILFFICCFLPFVDSYEKNGARGNLGENIAMGQSAVYQANRGWIDNEYEVKWKCGQPIDNTNYDHITQVHIFH